MAYFQADGWREVGELRGLPISARWDERGWFDLAILGPAVALEFRLLLAGSRGAGGRPLSEPCWALVAPHADGAGYHWVQGYGADDDWEHLRREFVDGYFARWGKTVRFGYGVSINECYSPDPAYLFSRPDLAGKALGSVSAQGCSPSAEPVAPLGPVVPGPPELTAEEIAAIIALKKSLLASLDSNRAAKAANPDFAPNLEMALVTTDGPYDAAAEAEHTPVRRGPYGRPDRTCVECGSPVYGEFCTHCHES